MNENAKALLAINAVKFDTNNLFTWTSGIKSPIYTDNRVIMSYVEQRTLIYHNLARLITKNFSEATCLAGTAVAGIAPCSFVAGELNLPMVFVRSSAKKHGTQKQIEGEIDKDAKVVIVEDLVSTGKSLKVVIDALLSQNIKIVGIVSIFTYNLNKSQRLFNDYGIKYCSLTNIEDLLSYCLQDNKLNPKQIKIVENFVEKLNEK